MKQVRLWVILGPLFGIAAVVLLFLGLTDTISGCVVCELGVNDTPSKFARVFAETNEGRELAAYLTLLGTFFFFGFVGYLRKELQMAEGDGGWLSSMAFGGGLVVGTVALGRLGLALASGTVVDHAVDPEVARTLYVLLFEFDFAFAAPMAALVAATSVVILRDRFLPRPIGLLGIAMVVFALAPLAPGFGAGVSFLWILLLAAFMLWRSVRVSTRAGVPL